MGRGLQNSIQDLRHAAACLLATFRSRRSEDGRPTGPPVSGETSFSRVEDHPGAPRTARSDARIRATATFNWNLVAAKGRFAGHVVRTVEVLDTLTPVVDGIPRTIGSDSRRATPGRRIGPGRGRGDPRFRSATRATKTGWMCRFVGDLSASNIGRPHHSLIGWNGRSIGEGPPK